VAAINDGFLDDLYALACDPRRTKSLWLGVGARRRIAFEDEVLGVCRAVRSSVF
jgi:hypothetical protein